MKRTVQLLVTGIVLTAMLFSIFPQTVLAAPKWAANSGKGPKVKFKDIEKNWARDYIEKLTLAGILKGVSDDKFAPEDSVESVQVLVMLVRALGLEEEALKYQNDETTIRNMAGIPAWARGYVRVALEKGLISEQELSNLRPGQNATRLDVAKYISRLFEDEEDLWAGFDVANLCDLEDLPDNLKAYIALVVKKGIMVGTPEGYWLPHNLVNRGQMAKIISLILNRLANRPEQAKTEVYGEIVRVRSKTGELTIETKHGTYTYQVTDDCTVYVDGKSADLEDVTSGQRARLVLARSGSTQEVVYIRAENPKETEIKVTGTISALTLGQDASITVLADNGRKTAFTVDEKTIIILNGWEVFLSDLRLEQKVTVKGVQEDKVTRAIEIEAKSDQKEVSGLITAVVTKKNPSLLLEDDRGRSYTFRITKRSTIRLNKKVAVLEELRPKDQVKVWALDDEALRVEAQRDEPKEEEIEGQIVTLILGENPAITIRTKAGREYTYNVIDDTRIRLNNKAATLDVLKIGLEVELTVKGETVYEIKAED